MSAAVGLFVRSLIGLDREAAIEAFGEYLGDTKFTADQIHFINLIVNELTANGVVEPARLYESPYIDHAPTGPDTVFPEADVDNIVQILKAVRANATPADGAACKTNVLNSAARSVVDFLGQNSVDGCTRYAEGGRDRVRGFVAGMHPSSQRRLGIVESLRATDRLTASTPSFTRSRAALATKLQFQLGQRSQDSGHHAARGIRRVDSFAQ